MTGAVAGLAGLSCFSFQQGEVPNVLLIAIDDFNTDIGCLGGPILTPNIDRFARRGMLFADAHCNAPLCNASRASLMTGRLPIHTGVYANSVNFREVRGGRDRVTLPQYFSRFNYETVAAGKLFHYAREEKPEPHPFSDPVSWDLQHRNYFGTREPVPTNWHQGDLTGYPAHFTNWGPSPDETDEETADWQNANFCAEYLQLPHDKPFFLACGIFRPHATFNAPPKYFDLYPPDRIELPKAVLTNDIEDLGPIGKSLAADSPNPSIHPAIVKHHEWKRAVQSYYAAATFADQCVGRLLDELEKSPYGDNTVVVLFSDHGYHLGSKQHWAKFTFWNRSTHIPLIIYKPGMTAGVCDRTVSLIDLYPTLVDLCNLPTPSGLDGQTLTPLLRSPTATWDKPVQVYYKKPEYEALITDTWRYIGYGNGEEELYNRPQDPYDWHNLVDSPEVRSVLEKFRSLKTSK